MGIRGTRTAPAKRSSATSTERSSTLARVGVRPSRWRIPWGHLADFTPELAAERELRLVGWTADTHDWRGDSPEQMLSATRLARGGIVLAHDGIGPGARRATAQATAELIAPLVQRARENGLEPGPLAREWPVPVPLGIPPG